MSDDKSKEVTPEGAPAPKDKPEEKDDVSKEKKDASDTPSKSGDGNDEDTIAVSKAEFERLKHKASERDKKFNKLKSRFRTVSQIKSGEASDEDVEKYNAQEKAMLEQVKSRVQDGVFANPEYSALLTENPYLRRMLTQNPLSVVESDDVFVDVEDAVETVFDVLEKEVERRRELLEKTNKTKIESSDAKGSDEDKKGESKSEAPASPNPSGESTSQKSKVDEARERGDVAGTLEERMAQTKWVTDR